MFKSFSEAKFKAAIAEKDYSVIKSYIISAIRFNPTFKPMEGAQKAEADIAIDMLKSDIPEIFAEYQELEIEKGTITDTHKPWDDETFGRQTFLLRENFCEERINRIRENGKRLANFQKPQEQPHNAENTTGRTTTKALNRKQTNQIPTIAAIVLLVLVVILVLKKLIW